MKINQIQTTKLIIVSAVLAGFILSPGRAGATAGDLDPTFGNGGVTVTDFSQTDDYAYALAVQSDGRIVVCGQSGTYPDLHSALVRYTKAGRLDSTFGTGGKVVVHFDPDSDYLAALAVQSDGKIVGAGASHATAFLVARFNTDGSVDQTFGDNGSVTTGFGDFIAEANAVVLQGDGKIIVAGVSGAGAYSELNDFVLARYNSDGSLDQGFGTGGKLKTHFPGVFNTGSDATSVTLQADGKLLVGGYYKNERTPHEFALARYNSNGSLDSTFGSAGKVTTRIGLGDAFSFGIALQRNGRIVLGGYSYTTADHAFTVAGYTSNGMLDLSFGNGGSTQTDFTGSTDDIGYAMTMQRDGKLVVAGHTGEYPEFDFALARYTSNGQLDQSFGSGGKVSTNFSTADHAYAVALQPNGRIVLAGISLANGQNFDFTVARYLDR